MVNLYQLAEKSIAFNSDLGLDIVSNPERFLHFYMGIKLQNLYIKSSIVSLTLQKPKTGWGWGWGGGGYYGY